VVETQQTKAKVRRAAADPRSIERGVRQLLCNKVMGNLTGIWLLLAEHLRLGTWDILRRWSGKETSQVEPRIGLQLIHEAALCLTGQRWKRTLSQRGFEVANGLPFVAGDGAVHDLLDAHTVREASELQLMLGKLRHALGHFPGEVLAIDPHRIRSYTKRQMIRRKKDPSREPAKQLQTFFVFDADSQQPICFTLGSSSQTITRATLSLLAMACDVLPPRESHRLVLADAEHYSLELLDQVRSSMPFDLLIPMPSHTRTLAEIRAIPAHAFKRRWIGYAIHKRPYLPRTASAQPYWQTVQRNGETERDETRNAFLCTAEHAAVEEPVQQYPKRWHCEEFFNANQALGWNRAGSHNLNVRYGQMSMALIAQAAISMLRRRLGEPVAAWDAEHLARHFFAGLEGDVRLTDHTILVTYYNAPNAGLLARAYANLPGKLENEGVAPTVPWLFDYKLDFRFK